MIRDELSAVYNSEDLLSLKIHRLRMQLTSIVALLVSFLLLLATVSVTDAGALKANPQVARRSPAARLSPLKGPRGQFAGRSIVESIKQRRKH